MKKKEGKNKNTLYKQVKVQTTSSGSLFHRLQSIMVGKMWHSSSHNGSQKVRSGSTTIDSIHRPDFQDFLKHSHVTESMHCEQKIMSSHFQTVMKSHLHPSTFSLTQLTESYRASPEKVKTLKMKKRHSSGAG